MSGSGTIVYVLSLLAITLEASKAANVLEYRLREETGSGKFIGNLTADAKLDQEYSKEILEILVFSFHEQSRSYVDYFTVDKGVFKTGRALDREVFCEGLKLCQLELLVQIQPMEHFKIIKVSVTVEDNNDNPPRFTPGEVRRTITEVAAIGTKMPLPTANDPDSPIYSVNKYELISMTDVFELHQTSGQNGIEDLNLVLKQTLDREENPSYTATIVAFDGGSPPETGTLLVNIVVTDINDNSPVFENTSYQVSVPENVTTGTIVLTIKAWDADADQNGEVIYSLTPKTQTAYGDIFALNHTTGELSVSGQLNYERETIYTLLVTGRNKDPDSLAVQTKVVINVVDVNDHSPTIRVNAINAQEQVQISENADPGSFVAHITVIDRDSGSNGQFSCRLIGNDFELEQLYTTEFKIVSRKRFDHEVIKRTDVDIRCVDSGIEARVSELRIPVDIVDENDNQPIFDNPFYVTSLVENNPVGAFLAHVTARDLDSGANGNILYDIEDTVKNLFNIDQASGNITVKVRLDHEQFERIDFRVLAYDQGVPPQIGTATVAITVIDTDDEPPRFTQPLFDLWVYENEPISTEVGKIYAEDSDSDLYNGFTYSWDKDTAATLSDIFMIEPDTGVIYSKVSLDRERNASYEGNVLAVATGNKRATSSAAIIIYVADRNDHDPSITFPNEQNDTIYITTSLPVDRVITRILATDLDIGENSQLSFNISDGNTDGYFFIDKHTGSISLRKTFNRNINREYGLVVHVKDAGIATRSAEAMLKVVVRPAPETALISNLSIVVIIGVVAGILIVVLTIIILVLLRRQIFRRIKYNNVPSRGHQKGFENDGFGGNIANVCTNVNHTTDLSYCVAPVTPDANIKREQLPQSIPESTGCEFGEFADQYNWQRSPLKQVEPEDPPGYSVALSKPVFRNDLAYKGLLENMNLDRHTLQKMSDTPRLNSVDKDSDSGCSADITHSMDGCRRTLYNEHNVSPYCESPNNGGNFQYPSSRDVSPRKTKAVIHAQQHSQEISARQNSAGEQKPSSRTSENYGNQGLSPRQHHMLAFNTPLREVSRPGGVFPSSEV